MGFGYGRTTAHYNTEATSTDGKRAASRFSNSMVAHVWNTQSQDKGFSGNGNFYFNGATLFSYGSHYVVGRIMADGVAFLNTDNHSVTTSGHQSDARGATSDRTRFHVPDLTAIHDELLGRIGYANKATIRRLLKKFAVALSARAVAPGEYGGRYAEANHGEEAGAYIARLAGIPVASWDKAKRDAEAEAKRAAAKKEAEAAALAERRALRLADMSDKEFREYIANAGNNYYARPLKSIATELHRARGLALKAKSGKLAAKSRLATLRERLARARAEVERFEDMREIRNRHASVARHVSTIRQWQKATPEQLETLPWRVMNDVADAGAYFAKFGRIERLKASAVELERLARIGAEAIRDENIRQRELERERQALEESERKRLWLAGERVGRIYFDAESGGAALRIIGDTLETSHGASVPLAHAVKAFRFVKLIKERGETWARNGKTIRVGHFQIDRIESDGSFVAGCHTIAWPEVERAARLANVFDCPPSADAVEPSNGSH